MHSAPVPCSQLSITEYFRKSMLMTSNLLFSHYTELSSKLIFNNSRSKRDIFIRCFFCKKTFIHEHLVWQLIYFVEINRTGKYVGNFYQLHKVGVGNLIPNVLTSHPRTLIIRIIRDGPRAHRTSNQNQHYWPKTARTPRKTIAIVSQQNFYITPSRRYTAGYMDHSVERPTGALPKMQPLWCKVSPIYAIKVILLFPYS